MSEQSAARPAGPAEQDRLQGLGQPDRVLMEHAAQAIARQKPDEATPILARLSETIAGHPEVLRLRAVALHQQKRPAEALALLRTAVACAPDDALLQSNFATLLAETGDREGALDAYRRSSELAPHVAATWLNLGRMLEIVGRIGEAREALATGIALNPDDLVARISYAQVLRGFGRGADAAAEFRHALRIKPGHLPALSGLSRLPHETLSAAEKSALAQAYIEATADGERIDAGFALANVLEDDKRYSEAFAVYMAANATKRRQLVWNSAAFSRHVRGIDAAFEKTPPTTSPADLGREVIFIVSMPRSGSTLVEQILAAHPQVEAGGELDVLPAMMDSETRRRGMEFSMWSARATAAEWEALGRRYLAETAALRGQRSRFTDKGLSNWAFVGAIRAMLPGARIVESRRDIVETCLSCFRNTFAHGQAFTYDLTELAAFARDYDHLVTAWRGRHPDHVKSIVHESLVQAPETEIAALLAFCGLDPEPACLRFHEVERPIRTASATQVREPLRTNTQRASHYGDLLAPLRRALVAR